MISLYVTEKWMQPVTEHIGVYETVKDAESAAYRHAVDAYDIIGDPYTSQLFSPKSYNYVGIIGVPFIAFGDVLIRYEITGMV